MSLRHLFLLPAFLLAAMVIGCSDHDHDYDHHHHDHDRDHADLRYDRNRDHDRDWDRDATPAAHQYHPGYDRY